MDKSPAKYKIDARGNYYSKFTLSAIVLLVGLLMLQLVQHTSYYLSIFLFVLIESYFLFKKQIIFIDIEDDIIRITYFQCLKRFTISSKIKDAKVNKQFDISFRSPEKKFTLLISLDKKEFKINKLDNFDEDDLIGFYEFFRNKITT